MFWRENNLRCSIVIPTRGRAQSLRQVIAALERQTDHNFEVIVAVDGEDAATRALSATGAASFVLSWVFLEQSCGPSAARNAAVDRATGELLLFLDDDTLPVSQCVALHRKAHVDDGDPWLIVRGTVREQTPDPGFVESVLRRQTAESQAAFDSLTAAGLQSERFACCGLNCSLRRDLFHKVGRFDPRLAIHEDLELGARLYRQGAHFVHEPGAAVLHCDTKRLRDYLRQCWAASAHVDAYRVFELGQRSEQTRALAAGMAGNIPQRWKARLAWEHPALLHRPAAFLARAAEWCNSPRLLREWQRLEMAAEYWQALRGSGRDLESLRDEIGWPLTILAFHSIARPHSWHERPYCTPPERFRKLLHWLRQHAHGTSIEPPTHRTPEGKRVLLTFDDGFDDFLAHAYPELRAHNMQAVLFVAVDHIGKTNSWYHLPRTPERRLMSLHDLRSLDPCTVTIGCHSATHPALTQLSEEELSPEVCVSKARLEDMLGRPVEWFCYPYGAVNARVRRAVARAGYRYAVTTRGGRNLWGDPLLLRRVEIGSSDTPLSLLWKLRTGTSPGRTLMTAAQVRWHALLAEVLRASRRSGLIQRP